MRTAILMDEPTPRQLADYLAARGLVRTGASVRVDQLGGGVSSDIVAVTGPGVALVVKRALPRLKVEQEWFADARRVAVEARALRFAYAVAPDAVPQVLDLDEEHSLAIIALAPTGWANWRDELLEGRIDPLVGRRLGELLAVWHAAPVPPELTNTDFFVQLRIDPFHRAIAARYPDLAPRIATVADRLLERKLALVHGDFSPKNVLAGGDGLWVLDWEVAHHGDPVFDVAFLLTHLLLKSIHRPRDAEQYRAVADAFLTAYGREIDELSANVGCLLLARVDGKSPAPYLRPSEHEPARRLGSSLLRDPVEEIRGAWERLA
jgi:5-methylthioribose kinase